MWRYVFSFITAAVATVYLALKIGAIRTHGDDPWTAAVIIVGAVIFLSMEFLISAFETTADLKRLLRKGSEIF